MMSDESYYDERGVANNMDDMVKDTIYEVLEEMEEKGDDEYRDKVAFYSRFNVKLTAVLEDDYAIEHVENILYHFGIQKALEIWVNDAVQMTDDLPKLVAHAIQDDMLAGEFSHKRWVAYTYPVEGEQEGEG